MTNDKPGAGNGGRQTSWVSGEHQHSVNAQSLRILQVIAELHQSYPEAADVTEVHAKLQAEDGRSWRWLSELGLIQGEPGRACLTGSGKQVVDRANLNSAFQGILENSHRLSEPTDRHASAVLALLHANYEHGNVPKP